MVPGDDFCVFLLPILITSIFYYYTISQSTPEEGVYEGKKDESRGSIRSYRWGHKVCTSGEEKCIIVKCYGHIKQEGVEVQSVRKHEARSSYRAYGGSYIKDYFPQGGNDKDRQWELVYSPQGEELS